MVGQEYGAEHEQMDATVNDALERARRALPTGTSAETCDECVKAYSRSTAVSSAWYSALRQLSDRT